MVSFNKACSSGSPDIVYIGIGRQMTTALHFFSRTMPGSIIGRFFFTLAKRSMKNSKLALALCSALFALPGSAQVALKPRYAQPFVLVAAATEHRLSRHRENLQSHDGETRREGARFTESSKQLSPTWDYSNHRWTVDSYMSENRTSGVLVLKNGKIVLERYGLGRSPQIAGPRSQSRSR